MNDTMWFDLTPEERASVRVYRGSEEHGDPTMLLMAAPEALPDWIRLPDEIGGAILKPLGQFMRKCPCCKSGHQVRHIECEHGYFVAECATHGFAWYTLGK